MQFSPSSITRIRNLLDKKGHHVLSMKMTCPEFYTLGKKLGKIVLKKDVRVKSEPSEALETNESLPYHMDYINIDYIGWLGMVKNEFYEPTWLIDSRPIADKLSKKDQLVLSKVICEKEDFTKPMYELSTKTFYYCPLIINPDSILPEHETDFFRVMDKISELMLKEHRKNRIEVNLGKNEALFINNRFMLHARGNLHEDSKRHLKRIWVRTG